MSDQKQFRIGDERFMEMDRAPLFDQMRVSYAVTANTDGASIYLDGRRGMLFPIRTVVDAQGEKDVERLFLQYHGMSGSIYAVRFDYRVYGHYLVDSVIPTSQPILKVVGQIRKTNPTHLVECVWTLYPIRKFDEFVELAREAARRVIG